MIVRLITNNINKPEKMENHLEQTNKYSLY